MVITIPKNIRKISPEEINRLLEENKGLIIHFYRKFTNYYIKSWKEICDRTMNYIDLDDIYQACYIGMWFAILTHDETKGKLSTWARVYINRMFHGFLETNKKKLGVFQFSELGTDSETEEMFSFENNIEDKNQDVLKDVFMDINGDLIRDYINKLKNEKHKKVILQRLSGMTFNEISKENGITKQRCHQIVEKMKYKLKKYEELCLNL